MFPAEGFRWPYIFAIAGISTVSVIAFQAVDIYQVHAFRRPLNQMARMISAWSVVFLLAIAVSFFFKLDLALSRVWLFSFWAVGLVRSARRRAPGFTRWCEQWMRDGRLTRRTVIVGGGAPGEALIDALKEQVDGDVRVVGVFDDRNDERSPTHLRGLPQARHRRRFRRIRTPHPHRSRDLLAADQRGKSHPRDAQEAVGAAGRHPPVGAFQQAAVPAALLFLYRHRTGARRLRPPDRGLGRRDEMAAGSTTSTVSRRR